MLLVRCAHCYSILTKNYFTIPISFSASVIPRRILSRNSTTMVSINMCSIIILLITLLAIFHYGTHPYSYSEMDFEFIELYNQDPLTVWEAWYKEAKTLPENKWPESMTMSTTRPDAQPAARSLLMRGYDERGFKIYTDYTSPKSDELAFSNKTALVFLWCFIPKGETKSKGTRQVRIEGIVEKLSQEENEAYFQKESVSSKIRAVCQHQSQRITSKRRGEMLTLARYLYHQVSFNPNYKFEMPEKWGGYIIHPHSYEFFQASPNALATRIKFTKRQDLELIEGRKFFGGDLPDGVFQAANDWVYEYLEF